MIIEIVLALLSAVYYRDLLSEQFPYGDGDWYIGWRLDATQHPRCWLASIFVTNQSPDQLVVQRLWLAEAQTRGVLVSYQERSVSTTVVQTPLWS